MLINYRILKAITSMPHFNQSVIPNHNFHLPKWPPGASNYNLAFTGLTDGIWNSLFMNSLYWVRSQAIFLWTRYSGHRPKLLLPISSSLSGEKAHQLHLWQWVDLTKYSVRYFSGRPSKISQAQKGKIDKGW